MECSDNIQELLTAELKKSREQFPESFSEHIYVLPAINDNFECQLEQQLQHERKHYAGDRIILITYYLENSYWVGILVEFQVDEKILRAEYINPVNRSNAVPDRLQEQFAKVYPQAVLQPRDLVKHDDLKLSSKLTVENLLAAAKNDQLTDTMRQKGNRYKLPKVEQTFRSSLTNRKNKDAVILSEEIQKISKPLDKDDEEEEITSLKSASSSPSPGDKSKIGELQNAYCPNRDYRNRSFYGIPKVILMISISVIFVSAILFFHKSLKNDRQSTTEHSSTSVPSALDRDEPFTGQSQWKTSTSSDRSTMLFDDQNKIFLYIKELRNELGAMPACARKTVIELLVYFEQKLVGKSTASQNEDTVISSLQKLKDQVKKEELLSENVKNVLRDLEIHITSHNYSVIVRYLNELLKKFRSLNVPEIQRLVAKAEEAAELIHNKDVILLIGTTGAGKSTVIQFLAGATMKEIRVEISPGKYLEHITAVGPFTNPDLNNVNSSPLQKSETRYIAPVTVPLKDILGAHETGIITLCDAPGFEDTAGPEVDIANSIGVIEALKGTKSVKLLVLSSYKSLGDRGQGIQKLAHILVNMVHGIEGKLDAIFYAFTKYPEITDINALLLDIKRSKVDEDVTLQSDTAFVTVLKARG